MRLTNVRLALRHFTGIRRFTALARVPARRVARVDPVVALRAE